MRPWRQTLAHSNVGIAANALAACFVTTARAVTNAPTASLVNNAHIPVIARGAPTAMDAHIAWIPGHAVVVRIWSCATAAWTALTVLGASAWAKRISISSTNPMNEMNISKSQTNSSGPSAYVDRPHQAWKQNNKIFHAP